MGRGHGEPVDGDPVRGDCRRRALVTTDTDPTASPPMTAAAPADRGRLSPRRGSDLGVPERSGRCSCPIPRVACFGRSPLSVDSRPWYLGALGELQGRGALGEARARLDGAASRPDRRSGECIDHVVVGPAGVFTINTKFHDDARIWVGSTRLLVNGQKTDHLATPATRPADRQEADGGRGGADRRLPGDRSRRSPQCHYP